MLPHWFGLHDVSESNLHMMAVSITANPEKLNDSYNAVKTVVNAAITGVNPAPVLHWFTRGSASRGMAIEVQASADGTQPSIIPDIDVDLLIDHDNPLWKKACAAEQFIQAVQHIATLVPSTTVNNNFRVSKKPGPITRSFTMIVEHYGVVYSRYDVEIFPKKFRISRDDADKVVITCHDKSRYADTENVAATRLDKPLPEFSCSPKNCALVLVKLFFKRYANNVLVKSYHLSLLADAQVRNASELEPTKIVGWMWRIIGRVVAVRTNCAKLWHNSCAISAIDYFDENREVKYWEVDQDRAVLDAFGLLLPMPTKLDYDTASDD